MSLDFEYVSQIVVAVAIFVVNSRVINDHTSYFNFILEIPMNYFSSQIPNGKLHLNYWFYDLHFDVVSLLVCSLAELVCAWLWTATAIKTVMAHSQLEVWAIFWCKFQESFFLYEKKKQQIEYVKIELVFRVNKNKYSKTGTHSQPLPKLIAVQLIKIP